MEIDIWQNKGYYKTIYADPPWKYGKGWGWGASKYYETMKLDEIMNLAVPSISAPNSHLYLWTPNTLLPSAIMVIIEWGFSYKTAITWMKNRSIFGYYFKGQTEQLLFAVKGSMPVNDRCLTTIIHGDIRKHSQKPASAYDLIEKASPTPRIELFARQRRDNWDAWGNEV